MKFQYVKTSNHQKFMAAFEKVDSGAAREAKIMLLAGDPGTGKSRCVDYFGSERNAIHIEGMPSMSESYVRELLSYELGCPGGTRFVQQKAIADQFAARKPIVILDEAQHGLSSKAAPIEYLRRTCEQAGSVLILVCHTSEKHRFGEHRLAHIATRISALVNFNPASLQDTALYLKELCEVNLDDGVIQQAFNESKGRYRLLTSACATLEAMARMTGKKALTVADTHDFSLCEDAMKSLRRGAK